MWLLTNGAAAFSSPAGRGPVWSSNIGDAHFQRHFWQTGRILLGGGIAHARAWWQQFVGVYKLWCNLITKMSSWRFGFSGMLLKQRGEKKKKTSSFRFKDSSLFNAAINSHCPTLILGKHITRLCPPPTTPTPQWGTRRARKRRRSVCLGWIILRRRRWGSKVEDDEDRWLRHNKGSWTMQTFWIGYVIKVDRCTGGVLEGTWGTTTSIYKYWCF